MGSFLIRNEKMDYLVNEKNGRRSKIEEKWKVRGKVGKMCEYAVVKDDE